MFSKRIHWDITPNALTLLLQDKRAQGVQVLDLTVSNPTAAGFAYDEAAIFEALSQPRGLVYEPSPHGLFTAREAVAEYYSDHRISVHPENIHLTANTSEAYGFLFKLLLNPGDEVLVPSPSYPLFEFLSGLEFGRVRNYNLRYSDDDGWRIDFVSLEAQLSEKSRVVVAVNPNNPTGSYVTDKEFRRLREFCASNELALIADEVFFDFDLTEEGPRTSILSDESGALCFALNGFSKSLALPQMKLSWIVTQAPETLCAATLAHLDLICDTYLSVNTPVQEAASALLKNRHGMQAQILTRCRSNLAFLQSAVQSSNISANVLRVEGGWSAMLSLPHVHDEEGFVTKLLSEHNVLVHPGYFFDAKSAHVVLSLLTKEKEFREGALALYGKIRN
jgi:alanine-synthesizing transaminase